METDEEKTPPSDGGRVKGKVSRVASIATFVEMSKALSIAAIPVVLAIGGWVLQREVQRQSLQKEYVALALSILREPDPTKVDPGIRAWAVELLNRNSEVRFDEQTTTRLKSGESRLPSEIVGPALTPTRERELAAFQRYLLGIGFLSRRAESATTYGQAMSSNSAANGSVLFTIRIAT